MSVDTVIQEVTIGRRRQSVCSLDLTAGPWDIDRRTGYGPGASDADVIPTTAPRQGDIPDEYKRTPMAELERRIAEARQQLGARLVILGHHYQRDEIVQFADFTGDSFKLAQQAQTRPEAEVIVFCGVHFMAETADILSRPDQHVILPNLAAGCSMADMADEDDVLDCWDQLSDLYGPDEVTPVTYMNSNAALKAFCGENGGIVCTSSNAKRVLEWAYARRPRVLFFPDQHLGRNTGASLGLTLDRMPIWDPRRPLGGQTTEDMGDATLIAWRGWCSVHTRFTAAQVEEARREIPGVRILVHPECPMEVVDRADLVGSTEFIIDAVESAPPGTAWGIGTEINLVRRLQHAHPEQTIFCLDPVICPCSTMYRIHPAYLCWVLEGLLAGEVRNEIRVSDEVREWSKVALERMLAVP